MACFLIEGGRKLEGEVYCKGAKNAVLPILAACVLCPDVTLTNVPELSDVSRSFKILEFLGCEIERDKDRAHIKTDGIKNLALGSDLTSKMRSSVIFLGSLLGRFKMSQASYPGGCELGARPIDMHLDAFRRLGADVKDMHGSIRCVCKESNLKGSSITLSFPSVGATENIILASVLANGETEIINPAREPEIEDLVSFLNRAGADISIESGSIHIKGVRSLKKVSYSIMPDRIEAATYMAFAAANEGNVLIRNCCPNHFESVTASFREMGCNVEIYKNSVYIRAPQRLKAIRVSTMPYPGFPTDAQSLIMAALLRAEGTSVIVENIFDSRFKVSEEFIKLGASLDIVGRAAIIKGVDEIYSADVSARDLRGGAALVAACLCARGKSCISGISHIDRGYENMEGNLRSIGASIERISKEQDEKG